MNVNLKVNHGLVKYPQYLCSHNTKATSILSLDTHTQSFPLLFHKLKWMSTRKTIAMLHVKPCCTRL